MLLSDPMLTGEIENSVKNDKVNCEFAIENVCNMYADMFASMGDELMQQRATDMRDIKVRMQRTLMGLESVDVSLLPKGSILVAKDLTPSMTAGINPENVSGIVTELGGKTSHSAILARALEIPAVVAVNGLMDAVKDGDSVVLDGSTGEVFVNPEASVEKEYEEKRSQFLKDKKELDDDLLTGGKTLSSDADNKKAEKKKQAAAKKAEKNAAKLAAKKEKLLKEIEAVKAAVAAESDTEKKEKEQQKLKALQSQLAALGSKKAALQMAKRTRKIATSVIAVVVVVALLVTYVATGAVRKGFISYLGWPAQTVTALTVTDGKDQKANIKVSTYNYYFATTYNNMQSQQSQYQKYGLDLSKYHLDVDFDKSLSKQTTKNDDNKEVTWLEYLHDEVLETIKSNYMYYLEAVKANDGKEPKITDEQQSDIDDTMKQYKEQAHKYGYTLSAYLVKAMGRGVTEKTFRQEAKIAYIAQNYKNDLSEKKASKTYSEDDYNKYLKENRDDLVSVSIRAFECDTEDDAKAFAKALKSDGSNFTALCSAYASSDFYKKAYKAAGYSTQLDVTKTTLKNQQMAIATADSKDSTKYPGLDWLYSKDRKAGDVKQYSTSVVYVLRPVALSETKTVNVRHILIKPETNSKNTSAAQATTKQWNDAKKKAEKILAQYNSGKKTEDAFAQLAKDNSADNNANDGGLYENVYPGQMVNSFGNWCFDSSRKSGDVAMVQTDYGYHIMYFVKQTNMPAWKYTAQQAMASSDGDADTKALEKSYSIKEHWFGSRYFEIDTDIDM